MQYIAEYMLATDAAELLDAHKDAHLRYRMNLKSLRLAAQIHSEEGRMIGSLVVIDAADRNEAERTALADPYCTHGIYTSVNVRPCEVRYCDLVAGPNA